MRVSKNLVVLIICTLSACSTESKQDSADTTKDVQFTCANGESISVRFFVGQESATLFRNGQEIELKQRPSGSGFIYSNGPNTIRGKGDELMVEIGRMLPIQCIAQSAA